MPAAGFEAMIVGSRVEVSTTEAKLAYFHTIASYGRKIFIEWATAEFFENQIVESCVSLNK